MIKYLLPMMQSLAKRASMMATQLQNALGDINTSNPVVSSLFQVMDTVQKIMPKPVKKFFSNIMSFFGFGKKAKTAENMKDDQAQTADLTALLGNNVAKSAAKAANAKMPTTPSGVLKAFSKMSKVKPDSASAPRVKSKSGIKKALKAMLR